MPPEEIGFSADGRHLTRQALGSDEHQLLAVGPGGSVAAIGSSDVLMLRNATGLQRLLLPAEVARWVSAAALDGRDRVWLGAIGALPLVRAWLRT